MAAGSRSCAVRATGRRHELRLVPPLGGPERRLTEIQPRGFLRAVTLAWCPDSTLHRADRCARRRDRGRPDALFVVWIDSGERQQLTTPPNGIDAWPTTDPGHLAGRTMAGLPPRRRALFRVSCRSHRPRCQSRERLATPRSAHDHPEHGLQSRGGFSNDGRSCSARKARSGECTIGARARRRSGCPSWVKTGSCRPSGTRGTGWSRGTSRLRAQLCRHQHLAHRHSVAWCAADVVAGCSDRVDAAGCPGAAVARRPARDVHLRPAGASLKSGRRMCPGRMRCSSPPSPRTRDIRAGPPTASPSRFIAIQKTIRLGRPSSYRLRAAQPDV